MNKFLQLASKDPWLSMVRHNGIDDEPQYQLIIDDERARALGLSMEDINDTLSTAWGSSYVNQFIYEERVKQVYLQGRASSRVTPDDLNKWYFRNSSGQMVLFSAFGSSKWTYGSPRYNRFNGISSVEIMGSPADGYSSGDAVKAVTAIAAQLLKGFKVQWHGLSYEEQMSGSQTPALYTLSVLVVFLCLAALYESWSISFSLLLVVPLGVLGTLCAVLMRGLQNFSHGAGSGSQHSIGTAVVGGMIIATFLAIFFVPMFYVLVVKLFSRKKQTTPPPKVTHHE